MFVPVMMAVAAVLAPTESPKLRPLLEKDAMPGWEEKGGKAKTWRVEEGVLHCTGGRDGGWWGSKDEYTDFVIEFEFKLPPGGNSGVYLRTPAKGHPSFDGMEVQILDDYDPQYKDILPGQRCGSIYKIAPPEKQVLKRAGEWNRMKITAVGDHITVELNGEKIVDARGETHPDILKRSPRGPLGFQNHHTGLWIRNIRFADLAPKGPASQPATSRAAESPAKKD